MGRFTGYGLGFMGFRNLRPVEIVGVCRVYRLLRAYRNPKP